MGGTANWLQPKPLSVVHRGKTQKMKILRSAFSSTNAACFRRCFHEGRDPRARPFFPKLLDNAEKSHDNTGIGSFFSNLGSAGNANESSKMQDFIFQKFDGVERAHDRSGAGFNKLGLLDGLNEGYSSLTDGMDFKLKKAATFFDFDPDEVAKDDYGFRPDVNFSTGMTYDTKDLDLKKPGVRKPVRRPGFVTTTEEVLQKADFRNVKFLANFLTEAGVIVKRSKTGISAKAQRKVAREIKTARAFGLMPFTTMGTKHFKYGQTMEDGAQDFEYEAYDHTFVDEDAGDPLDA